MTAAGDPGTDDAAALIGALFGPAGVDYALEGTLTITDVARNTADTVTAHIEWARPARTPDGDTIWTDTGIETIPMRGTVTVIAWPANEQR